MPTRALVLRILLLTPFAPCACAAGNGGGSGPSSDEAGSAADVGTGGEAGSPEDAGAPPPTDAGCAPKFSVDVASLTAHNTSASAEYDQAHFAANFGNATWVTQSGTTMAVDPTRVDMSLNPVTPGHVSNVDVHTLVPSRPDLRWFAHATPWFRTTGGPHVNIGLDCDTAAYVKSMVTDMRNRGFDGVVIDWYGKGSFEDSATLLLQQYLDTLPPRTFTFILMMDKGIQGLSEAVLEQQVQYVQSQYFGDPNYELEGGKPILMFFGVEAAVGGGAMAAVKAATGGNMVWVTEGAGSLANSWVDQCFDWTHDFHSGVNMADPYNLGSVSAFYAAVKSSSKRAFGSMVAGFDGTLTKTTAWSMGKYLPRGSGACVVQTAKTIDSVIPANVTRMQWVTWSDWEEGTEVESGVENDVTVTASLAGSTLSWTITSGTGEESTIDHYEVYASPDGAMAADLGAVPPGKHSFDLAGSSCLAPGTSYEVTVVAVGKPSIRDHASNVAKYAP